VYFRLCLGKLIADRARHIARLDIRPGTNAAHAPSWAVLARAGHESALNTSEASG
jgi:hypothetical protein